MAGITKKWLAKEHSDGGISFISKNSGKVLDIQGGSKDDGALLIQWDSHWGNNQRFLPREV